MRFDERYFSTVGSGSTSGGADVLGAAGLAGREYTERRDGKVEHLRRAPLGMALYRLFAGDNHAAGTVVEILGKRAVGKAYRLAQCGQGVEIGEVGARLIGELVLGWFRDPICKDCGGHGYLRMKGAPTLSTDPCASCRGLGRRLFQNLFPPERLPLAEWMAAELERDLERAASLAMHMLAPRMELDEKEAPCAQYVSPPKVPDLLED